MSGTEESTFEVWEKKKRKKLTCSGFHVFLEAKPVKVTPRRR